MTEESFGEFLRQSLDELDPVPPTPREAMWARIEAERRQAVAAPRRHVWLSWGAGLAAMLAIGIGIGRWSAQETVTTPMAVAVSEPTAAAPVNRAAYRVTVAQHLTSAEALLTSFRTQPAGQLDPEIAVLARDLLSDTRLLLDSPAADDPRVAVLLQDLELIIAQIARLSAPSQEEREIIREGMNHTEVLPRLRASQAAGT